MYLNNPIEANMNPEQLAKSPRKQSIESLLTSHSAADQQRAIRLCRKEEDPANIELLLSMVGHEAITDSTTESMLMELLADITHSSFPSALQRAIEQQPEGTTKAQLVSLAWQNAGDCSCLIPTLAEAMLSSHMPTVIEAMTGIEVHAERLPSSGITSLLLTLKSHLQQQPRPAHAHLIEESISLVSQMLLAVQSAERECATHHHAHENHEDND